MKARALKAEKDLTDGKARAESALVELREKGFDIRFSSDARCAELGNEIVKLKEELASWENADYRTGCKLGCEKLEKCEMESGHVADKTLRLLTKISDLEKENVELRKTLDKMGYGKTARVLDKNESLDDVRKRFLEEYPIAGCALTIEPPLDDATTGSAEELFDAFAAGAGFYRAKFKEEKEG